MIIKHEYKVVWGEYDGECGCEYFDDEYAKDCAYCSYYEAINEYEWDWAKLYYNNKLVKSYDRETAEYNKWCSTYLELEAENG